MTFTYNTNSTVVNDQRQHNTTYNYDSTWKVLSVVNDNGVTVGNMGYTNNYDMNSFQDGLTNTTTMNYSTDGYNNLLSRTDGNGVTSSLSYPTNGVQPYYPTGSKDSQGNSLAYVYDANSNLKSNTNISVTPNIGTSQTYNSNGTMHTSTDANGYVTTYGYTNGDLTSITPPGPQHSETLTYDSLSRVSSVTDGNGNQITYTYTNMGRVSTVNYKNVSGGDSSSLTYNYDDDGNVLSVVDSIAGTTSFTYDSLNRQTKKTLPDLTTIAYTYDATSNLTSLTDAGGTVTYGYNNLNEMVSLTEPKAQGGTDTITFGYDVKGQRTTEFYNSSSLAVGTYTTYDAGGRVTEVTTYGDGPDAQDYKYSYSNPNGPSGNYTSLRYSVTYTLNASASTTTTYTYDPLNRLKGATSTGAYPMTSNYSYDANGNRKAGSTTGSGISTPYNYTYQYSTTSNELIQVNSSTCTNDSNGNQTGCGSSYKETYNSRNQTTSMSSPNGSLSDQYVGADSTQRVQTTGSHASTYTYNILGLGTEKDSLGNLIAYTRDNNGNLIGMRTSSGNYTYLFDGLGSVVGLLGQNFDTVVSTYVYDSYGVTQYQTGTQYNPWQFASGYFDASTLYYKYGTRYYDRFGRWTQQDPIPSENPYLYANDDPVNLTDPSGKLTVGDFLQCLNSCLSSQGIIGFAADVVAASCVLACLGGGAFTVGTSCFFCVLTPFAFLGFLLGFCVGQCTKSGGGGGGSF